MLNRGPAVSPLVATAVISVVVGGIIGFYGRVSQEKDTGSASAGQAGMGKMGGGGGGKMGGGGGGGKMGGGQQPTPTVLLQRHVRNINLVERAQHKGLTTAQSQSLLPILKEIQSADKLTDKDSEEKLAKIKAVLTDDQNQLVTDMTPPRGGGGGGGMGKMGGGGGGATPYPGGPQPSGGPGGGGKADDANPFASERNKQSLTDLMTTLQSSGKK